MQRVQITALVVASALFMENIDSTVIATALPAIAADLRTDPIALKLAFTAYLLGLAVFIPASGWAADRFGARTVFTSAIAVFTLGSVACGLSSGLEHFVMARIVQGIGGAMMTPVGRLVVLRSAPKTAIVGLMAWLTIPALMGPLIGPPLGGFIATYLDWRWIFWINVPVGVVGILLARIFVPNLREERREPFDSAGFVLSGVALSGVVFGLAVLGQELLPLPVALALVAGGTVAGIAYLRHAARTAHPLLDLELFRIPTFCLAVAGGSLFRIGIGAIPFLLPLMLQLGLGLSPFQTGSLTFVGALGALLMKFTAAPAVRWLGFRRVLIWNGLLSICILVATGFFSFGPPAAVILAVLLVGGFFRSLEFTSINALTYADVPVERMSRATSLASVAQQVSLSLGVALGAFVLEVMRLRRPDMAIEPGDFLVAFLAVAGVSLVAIVVFARLPGDAGAEMAGREPAATRPLSDTGK